MPQADAASRRRRTPVERKAQEPTRGEIIADLLAKLKNLDKPTLARLATEIVASPKRGGDRRKSTPASRSSAKVLVGSGVGPIVSQAEARAALDAVTIEDQLSDPVHIGSAPSSVVAGLLHVSRSTLANWRQSDRVIAFRKGPRNYVYPVRQFHRHGPPEGLADVVRRLGPPDVAWDWLITPNSRTRGAAPIDRLKAGHSKEVILAAEGALDYL